MLKIIKPKDHDAHRQRIGALLDLLTVYQGFDLPLEKRSKSHFIIAESDEEGVYGGAVLYLQSIAPHLDLAGTDTNEEAVIKLTSAFQAEGEEYWTARICLCLEEGTSVAKILETQDICHRFYKNLYQAFTKFGEEQRIDYLAYTLRVAETYSMKTYEYWPYRLDVALADQDHEFGHGLLSLKGKAFKARSFKDLQYDKSRRQA